MREILPIQLKLGEVDISNIQFNPRSRDETHQFLKGIQHLFNNDEYKIIIFETLQKLIPENVSPDKGAPGMNFWKIYVLGMLRLNTNCDFDKLLDQANYHTLLRQMLGHSEFDESLYALQTIKDNIRLLTPKILKEINVVVIEAGLNQERKSKKKVICRCDSFVQKTNVAYPTDIKLLFESMRKAIQETKKYTIHFDLTGWRQYKKNIRMVKATMRKIQKMKHSTSKLLAKQFKREEEIKLAYRSLITTSQQFIEKIQQTLKVPVPTSLFGFAYTTSITKYLDFAFLHIDLIQRRIFEGEKIPHKDKIFSIFQPHTEWINKGKAGVPVELGLRVCIIEHPSGYVLHHFVMENVTDSEIVVAMIKEVQKLYPWFKGCSFDKGFHSPKNQIELGELLDDCILPKKGRCNQIEVQREGSREFKTSKRKHSAVESGINALQNHGLNKCLDHGLIGFKRYTAIAVVARNVQKLGSVLIAKELAKIKKQEKKLKKAA